MTIKFKKKNDNAKILIIFNIETSISLFQCHYNNKIKKKQLKVLKYQKI